MTGSDNKQTVVQFLVSLVLKLAKLFRTPEGEAYATFQAGDYHHTAPIRSNEFAYWLEDIYHEHANELISLSDMRKVIRELSYFARKMGAIIPISYRYAYVNGCLYVDLGNKKREQIEITPGDWHLIAAKNSPVKFVRKKGMAPLVKPEKGGSLNELKHFFKLRSDTDFVLMVCWVVGVMNPLGPFPLLVLQGPQGSSKSTSCRFLKSIVDPSVGGLISMPSGERNISIAAYNSYLLAIDNQSGIRPEVSDVLCKSATGYVYQHRQLHTDNGEIKMPIKIPVLINGITDIVRRHDLADRSIVIQTKSSISKSERIPEDELQKRWDENLPYFLGCFYDALAMALKNKDKVKIDWLPRMADFAKFVVEAEPALPFGQGAFLDAYRLNDDRKIDATIENDLVASTVLKMFESEPNNDWDGPAEMLLRKLNTQVDEITQKHRGWPKAGNVLSNRLFRCSESLRAKGIVFDRGHSGNRNITLININKTTVDTDINKNTAPTVQTVPENYLPDSDKGPGNNNGSNGANQLSYLGEDTKEGAADNDVDTNNTYIDGEI